MSVTDTPQDALITAEWLASVGFKWHQLDRQPDKQWLLWLGEALSEPRRMWSSAEDLGIELGAAKYLDGTPEWHCWLRSDVAHRYSRFLHLRYLRTQAELIHLVEGLTGQTFDPANNLYGGMKTPKQAAYLRAEADRLDQVIARSNPKWYEHEKDETRGAPRWEELSEMDKLKAEKEAQGRG